MDCLKFHAARSHALDDDDSPVARTSRAGGALILIPPFSVKNIKGISTLARQMTEDELLDYFELNFNLAADARRKNFYDEANVYESFNLMIEQDLYRFQSDGSLDFEGAELLPSQ